jgi:hypothetical protein
MAELLRVEMATETLSTGRRRYEVLPRYPHMAAADLPVWEAFLLAHPHFFSTVEYDVRVGPGIAAIWTGEARYARMARHLSQKRIDAVGYQSDQIYLIEVKPRASAAAIGQLLVYRYWFIRDFKPELSVVMAIVCSQDDPDLRPVREQYAIGLYTVEGVPNA